MGQAGSSPAGYGRSVGAGQNSQSERCITARMVAPRIDKQPRLTQRSTAV